jgi:hypothetical protein
LSDCDTCTKCPFPNNEWYPPSAIVYCRPQVMFYLTYCEEFRAGHWIPNPDGSNYTDPSIRSEVTQIPPHHAEQFAAEMDSRLKMCGLEGKLLEAEVKNGLTIFEFMKCRTCEKKYCPSMKALNYISGWRRRIESYRQFKSRTRKK